MHDYDRFAALFTDDGVWRIPEAGIELRGRAAIRANVERMQGAWECFVQTTHPGPIALTGDTASGRAYVHEFGRLRDGRSHTNYAVYHDRYRRVGAGWRFAERVYEITYLDSTPLAGTGRRLNPPGVDGRGLDWHDTEPISSVNQMVQ